MRRRGGSYLRGVSIDDRTGFKVHGRKLRQDGETGVLTTDYDLPHPQRFQRNPGPDGAHWRPGRGVNDPRGDEWTMKTHIWSIAGLHTQRPFLQTAFRIRIINGDGFAPGAAINIAANPLTWEAE